MNLGIFLIIALILAAVFFYVRHTRRKKQSKEYPLLDTAAMRVKAKERTVTTAIPIDAVKLAPRPLRNTPPQSMVHDAKGIRYRPNDDGTYTNASTNETFTWLMLYIVLSDSHRSTYEPPANYEPGMTLDVATEVSQNELVNFDKGDNLLTMADERPAQQETPNSGSYYADVATETERPSPTPVAEPTPSPAPSYDPPASQPSQSYDSPASSSYDSGSSNF